MLLQLIDKDPLANYFYAIRHLARDHSSVTSHLKMLFMIIEHFRNGDPYPIYARFYEKGRLAPAGLAYISSWTTSDLKTCYQVMETDDPKKLHEWIANWADLVDFEIIPVITSSEAAKQVLVS